MIRWKEKSVSDFGLSGSRMKWWRRPSATLETGQRLYQQSPVVDGGEHTKAVVVARMERKASADPPSISSSYDTAFSDKDLKTNSFSARTTWGVFFRMMEIQRSCFHRSVARPGRLSDASGRGDESLS